MKWAGCRRCWGALLGCCWPHSGSGRPQLWVILGCGATAVLMTGRQEKLTEEVGDPGQGGEGWWEISSLFPEWCSVGNVVAFISGNLHLVLSDCAWPQVTETSESETVGMVEVLYVVRRRLTLFTSVWRACFKFWCPSSGWTPAGNHHYFLLLHIVTSMWEPSLRNMLFWSKWGSYVLIIQQVHQFRWTHHPMWDIDNGGCSARVGIYRKSLQLPLNFSETKTVLKIVLIKTCKATTTVGEQNLPLQNVPLWHEDWFRLIYFKKEKTQKVFLCTSPLTV